MLPDQPGTYLLVLRISRATSMTVGKLGTFRFPAGWYAYAGSARGSGGLKARVSRHLRGPTSRHWHIDYFRAHAEPVSVWFQIGQARKECSWTRTVSRLPDASVPAPGFGASDCQCPTHLIRLPARPAPSWFAELVDGAVCRNPATGCASDPI